MKKQRSHSSVRREHGQARRTKIKKAKAIRRHLSTELLEDRTLLAGDLLYHNDASPSDVNGDGTVDVNDVTAVIGALRTMGPISLSSFTSSSSSSTGGAEGEPTSTPQYIDVDGDGFLSTDDATSVISTLRAESAPGDVVFTVKLTNVIAYEDFNTTGAAAVTIGISADNPPGNPITPISLTFAQGTPGSGPVAIFGTTIALNGGTADEVIAAINADAGLSPLVTAFKASGNGDTQVALTADPFTSLSVLSNATDVRQGDPFYFSLLVQDTRSGPASDRGVSQFGVNVSYDNSLVLFNGDDPDAPAAFFFNDYFNLTPNFPTGGPDNAAGIFRTLRGIYGATSGTPGNANVLIWNYEYIADGLRATNDTFNVSEDPLTPFSLDVLNNDALNNGTANFTSSFDTGQSVVLVDNTTATASDINFGSSSLTVTGGTLTLLAVQGGGTTGASDLGGTISIVSGHIEYTPPTNFNTPDTGGMTDHFTYTITDGLGITKTAGVVITVSEVNDAPSTVGDHFNATEDLGAQLNLNTVVAQILSNDNKGASNESGQTLEIIDFNGLMTDFGTTSPGSAGGTITVSDNGTSGDTSDDMVIYNPVANFNGVETFYYVISDNGTTGGSPMPLTATGTISITVAAVNDPPEVTGETRTTAEETPLTIAVTTLLSNDQPGPTAPAGTVDTEATQMLSLSLPSSMSAQGGTITISSGNVVYTPPPQFSTWDTGNTDTFVYQVTDNGTPNATALATVTVTVTELNDPPAANDDGGSFFTTPEDILKAFSLSTVLTQILMNDFPGPIEESQPPNQQTISLIDFNGNAPNTYFSTMGNHGGTITISDAGAVGPGGDDLVVYSPATNFFGVEIFTYVITDDGTSNLGTVSTPLTATGTISVTVTAVNDAPTLDPITDPAAILEDAGQQTVNLSGITAGGGETQNLTVTAVSDNPTLIATPVTVNYTPNGSTGSLNYTPEANQSGTALILVTVTDDGPPTDGTNVNTFQLGFTVTVNAVNDAPTLNSISNLTINEDAGLQNVNLTGISAGGGETQNLSVSATSSNPGLIPSPVSVSYTPNNATGSLSFTPVGDQNGTAVITVTVTDDGPTGGTNVNTFQRSFTVTVNPVNDAPTLDTISDVTINEDAGLQTVNLTGIGAGGGETQNLSVSATSSNAGLIPTPVNVSYTPNNATGSLSFTPVGDQNGTAVITVTVTDDGPTGGLNVNTFQRSFTVTVNAVNDAPTLNSISNLTINEDAGLQNVNLTGIGAGGGETQNLSVSATSSNPGLIPSPVSVSYTPNNATGSLSFTPVGDQNGTAVITVTVTDDGPTGGLNVNTFQRSFTVTVNAVNDAPTLDALTNLNLLEDAGLQTVNLAGISAGGGETQNLSVSATSSNPGLIPTPVSVSYTPNNATGSLSFTPVGNQSGTAVITVTVTDDGPTGGLNVNTFQRSFTVTVDPVNDAPLITVSTPGLYIEGDPATPLDDLATVTDVDNNTLLSLTVSIVGNFDNGHDQLSATGSSTVDVAVSGNFQTVTLTAVGGMSPTVADYQSVLRTVSYFNTEAIPSNNGDRTIRFVADDGSGTPTATTTVNQILEIVPPVLPFPRNDNFTVLEDSGSNSLTVLVNDRFSDNTVNPTITAVTQPPAGQGTVTITGTTITYNTDTNFFGTTSFTYMLDDDDPATNDPPATGTVNVTVTAVNDAPTLNSIGDLTFNEDEPNAANRTVNLTGISTGAANESQTLSFSATSSNPGLIPNDSGHLMFTYTSPGATGSLTVVPTADRPAGSTAETAVIEVVLSDDGDTSNGGMKSTTQSFTVTVNPVNDAPTLDTINDLTINEDASLQTVNLSGITAGGGETQNLSVSAVSSNPGLIPSPLTVNYTPNDSTGSLSFTPVGDQNGTAVVTVTVTDDGPTGGVNVNTFQRSFTVVVNAVNDEPTLNALGSASILEDAGLQTVNLSGIGAGGGESQVLSVSAVSSNTSLIPNPNVSYTSPDATGSLTYAPVAQQNGTAVITVTVMDDGGTDFGGVNKTTQSFTVTVTAVNDAPTLDAINNEQVAEDSGLHSINLTGITSGQPNETQVLSVSAVSHNTGLIPNPTIMYTSPGSTATLQYTPVANQTGDAEIVVTVMDDGGTLNSGFDSFERTFTISVLPVNDQPTLDPLGNLSIAEDASTQTVNLSNITAGGGETQNLSVSAVSSNTSLIPNPITVIYTPNNPTGSITFAPVPQANTPANGVAVITVTVMDDGGTLVGGVDTIQRSFTVTVTELNDPPTATNDSGTTAEDTAKIFTNADLTDNDSRGPANESGQTMLVTSVSPSSDKGGTVSVDGSGNVTYTPPAQFNTPFGGVDTFTYVARDNGTDNGVNHFLSTTGTVTVTVTEVNDAPELASGVTRTIDEDPGSALSVSFADILSESGAAPGPAAATDEIPQVLTVGLPGGVTSTTSAFGGAVNISGSNITYQPLANYNGVDTIEFVVTDNGTTNGAANPKSVTGTLTVTVNAVNDPPVTFTRTGLIAVSGQGSQGPYDPLGGPMPDQPGPTAPAGTVDDESGQTLTLISVTKTSGGGNAPVLGAGNTFTYDPGSYVGTAVFSYIVQDNGSPNEQSTGTVEIEVLEFVPSKFQGFVYHDANANGAKDSGEVGYAGVTVTLQGTDEFGVATLFQMTTNGDGHYEFDGLRPGEYDVYIEAMPHLRDGVETIYTPGVVAPAFGQFSVYQNGVDRVHVDMNLLGGYDLRTDFAKLGLETQFISIWDFLSSAGGSNIVFGLDSSGSLLWYEFGLGWDSFIQASFQFTSSDHTTADLTVSDGTNSTTIHLNSTQFRIKGTTSEGTVIQLLGGASTFGLASVTTPEAEPADAEQAAEPAPEAELVATEAQLAATLPRAFTTDVQSLAPPSLMELLASIVASPELGASAAQTDVNESQQREFPDYDHAAARAEQIAQAMGDSPHDFGGEFVEALDAVFGEGGDLFA